MRNKKVIVNNVGGTFISGHGVPSKLTKYADGIHDCGGELCDTKSFLLTSEYSICTARGGGICV